MLVLLIICYGAFKKVNVYDSFIQGSKESFDLVFTIFPPMLAMIFSVNILIESNFFNYIFFLLKPIQFLPNEIFPMMLLRPISGSASLATLNSIFSKYGPDSLAGLIGSVIQGSTDTTFYVITLYFGSIGVKKIKYSLWAGLFADLIGIISAIVVVKMVF